MYSFYIDGKDVKIFMNNLLKSDTFKGFDLILCEIKKDIYISIEGKLNLSWFDEKPENEYIRWENIKPVVYEHIKGKRSPDNMKIILSLSHPELIHNNAGSCSLTITYKEDKVKVTTGTAPKVFSLDKSIDEAWTENVKKFFKKMGVVQNAD
ncbi:MAG: DUF5721 family protein [Lachnospirales bacterium]